MTKHLPAVTA